LNRLNLLGLAFETPHQLGTYGEPDNARILNNKRLALEKIRESEKDGE